MIESKVDLPIFAARRTTLGGISSSEVLVYPPGNFPNSDDKASDWGRKWEVWQATTPDIHADPGSIGGLPEQNVEEAIVLPDNEIGRRGC